MTVFHFNKLGLHATYKYCDKHQIPYKKTGKLVVATSDLEVERLLALFERAKMNNVPDIKLLESGEEIKEIEPHCQGLKVLFCQFDVQKKINTEILSPTKL